MRVCPTVDGPAQPLISHRIGVETCASRQQCNYHKCHRCLYRGKPAAWEPATVAADREIAASMTTVAARGVPANKVPVPHKRHAKEMPAHAGEAAPRSAAKPKQKTAATKPAGTNAAGTNAAGTAARRPARSAADQNGAAQHGGQAAKNGVAQSASAGA